MRPDADQALRAHDDVTHTPTIFVRQLHAIHLAIGPVGRRRITGVSPTDCAETHAPLLPPAERSTITADCPTTPTVSIAASHKPMIAVAYNGGALDCPDAGGNATCRPRRGGIRSEEQNGADLRSHDDH
jgi:hypothetical protein